MSANYTKQTWANDAAGATPLSADRLNHVEAGIEAVDLAAIAAIAAVNTALGGKATPADISAAIGALTAGSPAQLDTFLEVYNKFLADESTLAALTTTVAGKMPNTKAAVLATGLAPADIGAATPANITTAINNLVNGAPGALDTLKEIADQLALDETAASAIAGRLTTAEANISSNTAAIGNKLDAATAASAYVPDLADVTVSAPGGLTAGKNNNVTAAGTYTAPAPAGTVAAVPQRFAITNLTTGTVTLTFPRQSDGATVSLTVLSGEVVAFRQKTTQGYSAEFGNKPIAQLDSRFLASPAWTGTPTLNGDAIAEYIQDVVAAFMVAGTNITKTYDDAANTLTISASGGSSGGVAGLATGQRRFNVKDYGAKGDGIRLLDAAVTSGANVVTSPSYTFVAGDVGKMIAVEGAGVTSDKLNTVLQGYITSISSGGAVLSTTAAGGTASNASTTVSGARCTFGTNDDAAFAAAQAAAYAVVAGSNGRRGGVVYMPAGRYIVSAVLTRVSYVSYVGDGRFQSIVAPITASGEWMNSANFTNASPGISLHDTAWGIEGGNMNCGGAYSSSTKPYNLYNISDGSCTHMAFWDTPATSIPFDNSQGQVTIGWNYVYNFGRCATAGAANPGASGIGVGVSPSLATIPQVIIGNVVIGLATATSYANGNNGIFCESQTGTTAANIGVGLRITDNLVVGCNYGITDAGGRGVLISGNVLYANRIAGIALSGGTLVAGMPGVDSQVVDNVIIGSTSNVTDEGHGIAVFADLNRSGLTMRMKLADNYIYGCYGYGIRVGLRSNDLTGLFVERNHLIASGLSGMYVNNTANSNQWVNGRIKDNAFVSNGTRSVANDTFGLHLRIPTTGLEITGNRAYDDAGASGTQTYGFRFAVAVVGTRTVLKRNNLLGNKTGAVQIVSYTFDTTTVIADNDGWLYGGGPTAVTVTASPMTYTAGNSPEELYVSGGTVTSVTKGGQQVAAGGNSRVGLAPAESAVITYTTAPTVTADKR